MLRLLAAQAQQLVGLEAVADALWQGQHLDGPQLDAPFGLVLQDWDLATETAAHVLRGWSAGDTARRLATLFRAAAEYGDPSVEAGYALLRTLMTATLRQPTVAFARKPGVVRVRMWLFGQLVDGADASVGSIVGLKSEVTET